MAEGLENKSSERRNLKPGLPLNRGDSGYISPVTPSSEHSTPSRTPFHMLGGSSSSTNGTPGRSSTAPAAGESTITTDGIGEDVGNNDVPVLRPILVRGSSTPVLDVERTPGDLIMLQRALQCPECRNLQLGGVCNHQYCIQINTMWKHWLKGACSFSDCGTCQLLIRLLEIHSNQCKEPEGTCPVQKCRNMRKGYPYSSIPSKDNSCQTDGAMVTEQSNVRGRGKLRRRSSLDSNLVYSQYGHFTSGFDDTLPDDSPEMQMISNMAEEIVNRLDQEEPLFPHQSDYHDDHSPTYYSSFHQLQSLYSISEDRTPTSGDAHFQSFPSGSFGSFGQGPISGEIDGINLGADNGGAPSMGGNTPAPGNNPNSLAATNNLGVHANQGSQSNQGVQNDLGGQSNQGVQNDLGGQNSLGGEEDDASSYPNQVIKYQLRRDILTVGSDSHYYQSRDYNAADTSMSGGFGTVHYCTDLTTKQMFAMKHNSKDDAKQIASMHTEASLLSRLGEHDHVIQIYGAVMDEQKCAFQPPRVYKMMMELAEHGNLSELLKDEQNCPVPLEADQSLYYFRQLLLGVKFLHDNSVLHLDIKSLNLLIFNEGKTLKLCDFGTAMRMDCVASTSRTQCCMTPLFAAPEICREELPRFSADIWSCMCVLVEMVTAQSPWHKLTDDGNQFSIMFAVGSYKDELMESDLIPCVETLSPELVELMRLVFRSNHTQRSTALELLSHPLIVNAGEYESQFDGYGDEYDEEMDEGTLARSDAEAEESGCGQDIQPSLSSLSHSTDTSGKRLSKDSGTGSDIDQDSLRGYSRKSSHGRNSDSGLDTPSHERSIFFSPCPEESDRDLSEANTDIISSRVLRQHSTHGVLSLSPHGLDSYSLSSPPTSLPLNLHHPLMADQTNYAPSSLGVACPSFLSHSHSTCSSCDSRLVVHQCSCPVMKSAVSPASGLMGVGGNGRLRHSNSAPAIGTNYHRRHSLQPLYSLNSDGQIFFSVGSSSRKTSLRRSSYASSGPDIDSPEGRKKFIGIDSPTRKEVASQTQDPDEESEKEEEAEKQSEEPFSQPVSILLSVLDSNKVASLTSAQSVSTSGAPVSGPTTSDTTAFGSTDSGITVSGAGDIAGNISRDRGAPSSPKVNQGVQKFDDDATVCPKQSSLDDDDDDDTIERDIGRRNVTSTTVGRATFYETIC